MGSKFRVQGKYLEGPNHMKIWPETVPSEVDKNLEKGIHFFIESLSGWITTKRSYDTNKRRWINRHCFFCHQSHILIYRVGSAHAQLPPSPGSVMLCAGFRGAGPVQTSSSSIPDACQCIGVYKYHINVDKCVEIICYLFHSRSTNNNLSKTLNF